MCHILTRSLVYVAVFSWLLPILPGCGFHLRGAVVLPQSMAVTYLQDSHPPSDIALPLRNALTGNNVRVTDHLDQAGAVLQLSDERIGRRLLTTRMGATLKDYELYYAISITVRQGQGAVAPSKPKLLSKQRINVTREMTFDETKVLAKTSEQKQLRRDMLQDAVRQILRRLQAIK